MFIKECFYIYKFIHVITFQKFTIINCSTKRLKVSEDCSSLWKRGWVSMKVSKAINGTIWVTVHLLFVTTFQWNNLFVFSICQTGNIYPLRSTCIYSLFSSFCISRAPSFRGLGSPETTAYYDWRCLQTVVDVALDFAIGPENWL